MNKICKSVAVNIIVEAFYASIVNALKFTNC